jgi:hypothetical protein
VRLFKRKASQNQLEPCPRCSQLVGEEEGSVCPMCGWDLHESYQGPTRDAEGETEERFRSAAHEAQR